MSKQNNLTDFLTDVADAIREKKGTSEKINPQDFSEEIRKIGQAPEEEEEEGEPEWVESFTVVDGVNTEFVNQNTKIVGTLTYKRKFKSSALGVWQPLFVPFEIPVATLNDMGYEVAYFNDFLETFDSNGDVVPGNEVVELVKIKHGILKANYPYAIKATKSEALTMDLVLTDATLYQTASEYHHRVECSSVTKRFEFMGTYRAGIKEDLVGADGTVYVMSGGGLKSLVNGGTYGAFRLYMTITHKDGSPYIESN